MDTDKSLRRHAVSVAETLQGAGFTAYWAGGCVRDMLLGTTPKDYDIATAAGPDDVLALFSNAVPVGKAFGVVRVRVGPHEFEVATFREDVGAQDGRHPEGVRFSDPQTDAQRRDFTVNALFYDPVSERLYDYVDGRKDLESRHIRFVGHAESRIREDHLRLLRAVRFASTLQFALAPDTLNAIQSHAQLLSRISAERVRQELVRMFTEAPQPGEALRLLDCGGLLAVVLPEVAALKGQAQPPQFHPEGDVFEHTVLMLNHMQSPSPSLAFAVLLHDIGKPPTARQGADRIRFHGHANIGATMAETILRRLRFPSHEIEVVTHCVGNHMRFMEVQRMKESTLRRLIARPTFETELELHRLDCLASHESLDNYEFLLATRDRLASEPVLPAPWITGHDLMALGVPEGPLVGKWHRVAYDAQLERRFADRDALLDWLRNEIHAAGPAETET